MSTVKYNIIEIQVNVVPYSTITMSILISLSFARNMIQSSLLQNIVEMQSEMIKTRGATQIKTAIYSKRQSRQHILFNLLDTSPNPNPNPIGFGTHTNRR